MECHWKHGWIGEGGCVAMGGSGSVCGFVYGCEGVAVDEGLWVRLLNISHTFLRT